MNVVSMSLLLLLAAIGAIALLESLIPQWVLARSLVIHVLAVVAIVGLFAGIARG